MAAKFKLETFTTPVGTATMAFLNKPSTTYNADGTYSVKLTFEPDEMVDHIARFDKLIEDKFAEVLKENPKYKKQLKKAPSFQPQLDDEGDETGKIIFNFKRNAKTKLKDGTVKINKVKLIDADGNPVTDEVWSGSKIAVRYFSSAYFLEKDKEVGVSLKLTHALVAELVSGNSDGSEDTGRLGFGKIEGGYKAKKATTAGDDEEDNSDNGDDSGDF